MAERRQVPPAPVDDYFEARPLLRHVRVMEQVMEWVDDDPKTRAFHADLHCAYMDVLSKELAPHALTLALAITELENAFPEIAALVKDDGRKGVSVQNENVPPPLKIGSRVTRKHGEEFAEVWREMQSGEIVSEAFGGLGLVEWPEDDPNRPLGEFSDPRQDRYHDITDEIAGRAFDAVMPAVAEAFVNAARAILARERGRN